MVTGATAGIGFEICRYAAKEKNLNVVLVGRNIDKLKQCQKEIQDANPKIQTRTLKLDFNESTELSYYQNAADEVKDLDISIFVNNAGVMHLEPFESLTLEQIKEMVETNVYGVSVLAKIFTDRFLKRTKRSAIVNVGSVAGHTPLPFNQHYAGTKAFNRSFSTAVEYEIRNKIDLLCHCPGYVTTKLSCFADGPDAATPKDCAYSIFRDLGYEIENQPIIIQEFSVLLGYIMQYFSEPLTLMALNLMMKDQHKRMKSLSKEN